MLSSHSFLSVRNNSQRVRPETTLCFVFSTKTAIQENIHVFFRYVSLFPDVWSLIILDVIDLFVTEGFA